MARIISIDGKTTCIHKTPLLSSCIRCYYSDHPIVKCFGEAHQNPYADNCSHCAPFWNELPAFKGMSPQAQWTLKVLEKINIIDFPNILNEIFSACEELQSYGYVEFEEKEITNKCSTAYFLICRITNLGRKAVKLQNEL